MREWPEATARRVAAGPHAPACGLPALRLRKEKPGRISKPVRGLAAASGGPDVVMA